MQKSGYEALRDVIEGRRTVRRYTDAAVPEEDVRRILDAARYAPSSGNEQPWKFLIVRDRRRMDELRDAAMRITLEYCRTTLGLSGKKLEEQRKAQAEYIAGCLSAPVLVAVLVDREAKWARYSRHDGALAAANLMLAARALGYGTIYGTDGIPEAAAREVLSIPERYEFVILTPIGVPESWPEAPERKALDSFLVYERFE
jgi:nitroreductase